MNYVSTRDTSVKVSSAQAITRGISADGGLFVPESFPSVSLERIEQLSKLDYIGRAKAILSLYLTDFTEEELDSCVRGAYESGFSSEKVAPLAKLEDGVYILELFRGPTCAFKDMALQMLPHLLTVAGKKAADGTEIVILVATSGDTGQSGSRGLQGCQKYPHPCFLPRGRRQPDAEASDVHSGGRQRRRLCH